MLISVCLIAFVAAWLGCAAIVHLAPKFSFLDAPGDRSSHSRPTPTSGGVAIILAVTIAVLVGEIDVSPTLAIAAWVLGITGFVDDRTPVSARAKLLIQFAMVGLLMANSVEGNAGFWLLMLTLSIPVVGMINMFNFMDGIDGMAAQQAIFMLLLFGLFNVGGDGSNYLLAAAIAGFALWNAPPARLFMGDSGSLPLGLVLASPLIMTQNAAAGPIVLIAWSLFVIDAGVTLLDRVRRNQPLMQAHKDHVYQRLSRRLGAHRPVTLLYLGINIGWCLPLAMAAQQWPTLAWWLVAIAWGGLGVAAAYALNRLASD